MLDSIDLRTFLDWLQYEQQEPWGEIRQDYRTALVAHTMASLWSKKAPAFGKFVLANMLHSNNLSSNEAPDLQQQFMALAAQGIGKWQPKT